VIGDLTGVYVEKAVGRSGRRWVAVIRTKSGFDHIRLTIDSYSHTHDQALAYAQGGGR
jgi:hypothetical protein